MGMTEELGARAVALPKRLAAAEAREHRGRRRQIILIVVGFSLAIGAVAWLALHGAPAEVALTAATAILFFVLIGVYSATPNRHAGPLLKDEIALTPWLERVLAGESVVVSATKTNGPIVRRGWHEEASERAGFLLLSWGSFTPQYMPQKFQPVDPATAPVEVGPGDRMTLNGRMVEIASRKGSTTECLIEQHDVLDHARWMARMLRERELMAAAATEATLSAAA